MKSLIFTGIVILVTIIRTDAQKTYTENGGEIIFAFSDVEYMGENLNSKMRFTLFLHLGRQRHFDFDNNFGIYTGLGLRNIGFITDHDNYVEKRRSYALGIPAAFKIGSFNNHLYFYGGGECELFFHYKQKQISGNSRSKYSEWFSSRTNRLAPSVFCGMQFPGGINVKCKYYPGNFLNKDFRGRDFGLPVDYSDYEKTQIFYIALTFNMKSKDLKNLYNPDSKEVRFAENR